MTARCAQCGHNVAQHLQEAAAKVASWYRVPTARVHELLVRWWEKSILWAWDNEHPVERKMRDLTDYHDTACAGVERAAGRGKLADSAGGCTGGCGDSRQGSGTSRPGGGTATHVGGLGRPAI